MGPSEIGQTVRGGPPSRVHTPATFADGSGTREALYLAVRLVYAGAVALAPRAGDLHAALAAEDADEAAHRVLLPTGRLDNLLQRGPALALEHRDDLSFVRALARLAGTALLALRAVRINGAPPYATVAPQARRVAPGEDGSRKEARPATNPLRARRVGFRRRQGKLRCFEVPTVRLSWRPATGEPGQRHDGANRVRMLCAGRFRLLLLGGSGGVYPARVPVADIARAVFRFVMDLGVPPGGTTALGGKPRGEHHLH